MKIYEALALRTSLQKELAELIMLRKESYTHPEDEKPEFSYDDLDKAIADRMTKIVNLKVRLMETNLGHTLNTGSSVVSIHEAVLRLADNRLEIENLREMLGIKGYRGLYSMDRPRTTISDIKMVKQVDPQEILRRINKLEEQRQLLDNLIQEANHTIELID